MIGFGVLILVIVALASLAVVFRGGDAVSIDLHWFTIKTSAGIVFLAGAVALALAVFGLSLVWEGLKRGRKRRKETKELRQRATATEQTANTPGPGSTQATPATPRRQPPDPDEHFDTAPRDP
ncbi:MAG: hypothetical protein H0V07_14225 [Propionibacteriales bacterium]|nr:hypothetical protein [Propionibacteriales bacterium]